jgi:ketol-acid reductoisomerase
VISPSNPPRHRWFREADADVGLLRGRTVAILGYGLLGRPLALNLRDTLGAGVTVGSIDATSSATARDDGFAVASLEDAAATADVALVLVPDEAQPDLVPGIARRLRPGATLVFASGYALAYGLVAPPETVDVVLFAPRMSGDAIRQRFLDGRGYVSYVGVERDVTTEARPRLLALAAAAGSLREGALEMSAREEALLDLYVEQACGPWLGAAILSAFQVGTEAGLPPLGLLLELYLSGEMAETFAQMARDGFLASTLAHGYAAAFGGMTGALGIDRDQLAEQMRGVLRDIEAGEFTRALQDEFSTGYPCRPFLERMLEEDALMNRTERHYRSLRRPPEPI